MSLPDCETEERIANAGHGLVPTLFLGPHTDTISHEDTMRLIVSAQAGDIDARNRIVLVNLRWAHKVAGIAAKKYREIDFDDATQVASLAMLRAIERFDVTRGLKFLTYATRGMYFAINKLRTTSRLIKVNDVSRSKGSPVTREKAERAIFGCFSLSDPRIQGIDPVDPGVSIESLAGMESREYCVAWLQKTIDRKLSPRDQFVIRSRLSGDTLKAIGSQIGLSRERVRQIEKRIHSEIAVIARQSRVIREIMEC